MTNIAIYNTNQHNIKSLEKYITNYFNNKNITFNINIIFEKDEILESKNIIDILFLQLDYTEYGVIDIAKKMREELFNEYTKIIYLSSSDVSASKIIKTRPIDLILEPIQEKKINETLNIVTSLINRENKIFTYKIRQTIFSEKIQDIVYFESIARKVKIVTKNYDNKFYDNLKNIHSSLKDFEFVYTHKSFLVNSKYIKNVNNNDILLSTGELIPLSRVNKNSISNLINRKNQL